MPFAVWDTSPSTQQIAFLFCVHNPGHFLLISWNVQLGTFCFFAHFTKLTLFPVIQMNRTCKEEEDLLYQKVYIGEQSLCCFTSVAAVVLHAYNASKYRNEMRWHVNTKVSGNGSFRIGAMRHGERKRKTTGIQICERERKNWFSQSSRRDRTGCCDTYILTHERKCTLSTHESLLKQFKQTPN